MEKDIRKFAGGTNLGDIRPSSIEGASVLPQDEEQMMPGSKLEDNSAFLKDNEIMPIKQGPLQGIYGDPS